MARKQSSVCRCHQNAQEQSVRGRSIRANETTVKLLLFFMVIHFLASCQSALLTIASQICGSKKNSADYRMWSLKTWYWFTVLPLQRIGRCAVPSNQMCNGPLCSHLVELCKRSFVVKKWRNSMLIWVNIKSIIMQSIITLDQIEEIFFVNTANIRLALHSFRCSRAQTRSRFRQLNHGRKCSPVLVCEMQHCMEKCTAEPKAAAFTTA